jgi:RNA polymerase sigma-70 factor (ECF subfamily)
MGKEHRTTEQLVLRIHGGDEEAFNQLFMRYYPRLKLLVRLHMLDKLKAQIEADDVIQEIYLEVYKNFDKFEYRDPNSFYKWLVKVIGWKVKDFDKYFFKTQKRQPGETLSLQQRMGDGNSSSMEFAEGLTGASSTPSQIVMEQEGYRMLERALERLPLHFRRVIRLRHLEQRSVKETAEILEMTPNAVNVLFHRAQRKLHEILKEMSYFTQ